MAFARADLSGYRFDAARIAPVLAAARDFKNEAEVFALISFGGTISSEYEPGTKNIHATSDNKALNLFGQLKRDFNLGPTLYTGLSLVDKDSREVSADDVRLLLDLLNGIRNRRVLVTCGTFLLPEFACAAARHVSSRKIIGFTGSMLVQADNNNDVAVNVAGAVSAANAVDTLKGNMPFVFASFHGEFYSGAPMEALNLHPELNS